MAKKTNILKFAHNKVCSLKIDMQLNYWFWKVRFLFNSLQSSLLYHWTTVYFTACSLVYWSEHRNQVGSNVLTIKNWNLPYLTPNHIITLVLLRFIFVTELIKKLSLFRQILITRFWGWGFSGCIGWLKSLQRFFFLRFFVKKNSRNASTPTTTHYKETDVRLWHKGFHNFKLKFSFCSFSL